jgi:hypothetical protein
MSIDTGKLTATAFRGIPELATAREVSPRAAKHHALRDAARAYQQRFKTQGEIITARSVDIAAAPYPVAYGFHDAVTAPHVPMISMVNRMIVVRFRDFDGVERTLVWEPTVREGSMEAPFYHQLLELAEKIPGGRWATDHLLAREYHDVHSALEVCGLDPADVDYISFDHLHVQDVRLIAPIFPNATLIVHRAELATFESLHPMQWAWYVDGGIDGIDPDRFAVIDGDVELGEGLSLIWTPGHTDGNHSLCLHTPDGVWVSSENGISADNWQPDQSRIPGLKAYHRRFGREVVPNANTLEDAIDQYDSMVIEKTLADPSPRDPRWLQILPSSELAPWRRHWPVVPTFHHGGITYTR